METRLGITRAYASMQTSAAKAMQNLLTNGEQVEPPSTERQLRPLVKLSPEEQREAWTLAVEKAAGGKVTGKNVEEAVTQLRRSSGRNLTSVCVMTYQARMANSAMVGLVCVWMMRWQLAGTDCSLGGMPLDRGTPHQICTWALGDKLMLHGFR